MELLELGLEFSEMRKSYTSIILLVGTLVFCGCSTQAELGDSEFVSADFPIPQELKHDDFRLRPLKVSDASADYEAVMESKVELRALFGGDWPQDDFTLEQNRSDLEMHQKAFDEREAFTYSVFTPDGQRILGCVYIHPAEKVDAQVVFWIRTSELEHGLSEKLQLSLRRWLTSEWPFTEVAFPGRE